ncbi:LCCL domain-containing protein [Cognatishimia maritima]|uniref:LCCL domain-containing protein n=1 Tax=Cognatishimia maritima TaxID=870908 RepID=A0A1M5JFY8_9RHOB|nr:LCCL domain-containing protein [Cognatishimia maritima]
MQQTTKSWLATGLCLGVLSIATSGDALASDLPDCPIQFAARGDAEPFSTEPFDCHCTAEARNLRGGYAYGSGPYDGISNICMVALHAGATGKDGGDVHVIPGPGLESYTGTLANGVFSADWEWPSQFGAFDVVPYPGN